MDIFSDTFNTPYQNNAAMIICYKSRRKNAKCSDIINIRHQINKTPDRKISDSRITDYFISVLDQAVARCKDFNHIELSLHGHIFKQSVYTNANGDLYHGIDDINIYTPRMELSSVEGLINYLYDVFAEIFPYNTMARKDIFNNSSVKYIINKFYH